MSRGLAYWYTRQVLNNDSDIDGDTLTVKFACVPAKQGTVTYSGFPFWSFWIPSSGTVTPFNTPSVWNRYVVPGLKLAAVVCAWNSLKKTRTFLA